MSFSKSQIPVVRVPVRMELHVSPRAIAMSVAVGSDGRDVTALKVSGISLIKLYQKPLKTSAFIYFWLYAFYTFINLPLSARGGPDRWL